MNTQLIKPDYITHVNWGHPSASELILAVPFRTSVGGGDHLHDLVSGWDVTPEVGDPVGPYTWEMTPYGPGMIINAGWCVGLRHTGYARPMYQIRRSSVTMFALVRVGGAGNRTIMACNGGVDDCYNFFITGGNWTVGLHGLINIDSGFAPTDGYYLVSMSVVREGYYRFLIKNLQTGDIQKKVVYNKTAPPTLAETGFYIGRYATGDWFWGDWMGLVYLWRRYLSDEEILSLFNYPFQLLR